MYPDVLCFIFTALPKSTLTVKPNTAYTGETVTLMCSTRSDSIWNYQWYKDRNYNVVSQSVRHTITGDTLTIRRAAESDQGRYWCEGNRVSRPTSSQPSDPVSLTVKGELLCCALLMLLTIYIESIMVCMSEFLVTVSSKNDWDREIFSVVL